MEKKQKLENLHQNYRELNESKRGKLVEVAEQLLAIHRLKKPKEVKLCPKKINFLPWAALRLS